MAGISKLKIKCAKCGSCAQVCPVFKETGRESHSARGKLHLFQKGGNFDSAYFNELLSKCIQCGACDDACPRDLRPSQVIRTWRGQQPLSMSPHGYQASLARNILKSPSLLNGSSLIASLLKKLPLASGLRQKIATLIPHENHAIPHHETGQQTALLYYPGCLAQHFQTDIVRATRYLASLCGFSLSIPAIASCCGVASATAGKEDEARAQAVINIEAYEHDTGPILTSCGSCYAQLKSYPELFEPDSAAFAKARAFADRVQEFSTFFLHQNKLIGHGAPQRIYYHDPCHLRFGKEDITDPPRQLIANLNGVPVVNSDSPLGCCGQGGLFGLVQPLLSAAIFDKARQRIKPTAKVTVVTTCSSCLMAWQQGTQSTEITAEHLSVFLAKKCENC